MIINSSMKNQLEKINRSYFNGLSLPFDLSKIIEQGFTDKNHSVLSVYLLNYCGSVSQSNFEDEIAYECFVNSFHMEDYVENHFIEYSIFFTNELIKKWKKLRSEDLNVIISLDDESLLPKIKFHVKRYEQEWLAENELESYIQPILITTQTINI